MVARAARKPSCPVEDYAKAVVYGDIVAGRLVRLACERHLRDLVDGPKRGLRWDKEAAMRAIKFFGFLRLETPDGPAPFKLEPFQKFKAGCLYGWKGADGFRRFRTAYIEEGKGSGKTPFASGLGLYALVADDEPEPEVYCGAVTYKQASIAFRDAQNMARRSPDILRILDGEVGQHNIAYPRRDGFMRPVSSEHRGLDGPRPHFAIIDEIHEHPTSLVVDKLRAGTKARRQAIIFEITNSGYDRTSVCWHHHEYSVKVLEGLQDDSWFAYVCQLDPCEKCRLEGKTQPTEDCQECDDWRDEAVWPKANPGLDTILPRKYLREQVREANGMPTKEGIVKRLNFCIWTEAATRAIPMDKWDACAKPDAPEPENGRECFGGLDIGATSDFTAFTLLFPHDDAETVQIPVVGSTDGEKREITRRSYTMRQWFWLPEHPVKRDERMTALIQGWRRAGWVRTTPGEVVDYDVVLGDIYELGEKYTIKRLALDRGFQGNHMAERLILHFGEKIVCTHPQGILSMNAPFREFIELLILRRLFHDGSPVMRWMASNTAAETRGGLIKPSKEESGEKIDGISAAVMAMGVAMAARSESWYTKGSLRN